MDEAGIAADRETLDYILEACQTVGNQEYEQQILRELQIRGLQTLKN